MKNLPVRPLAPRRKTPGQLYPAFNDLPGWDRNILKPSTCVEPGRVLAVTVSNKLYINTQLSIKNELTLMIPSSSLLAFEFLYRAIDESSLTSLPNLLFFSACEKIKNIH